MGRKLFEQHLNIAAHAMTGLALVSFAFLGTAGAQEKPKKKGLVEEISGQGYGMAGCGLGSILFGEQEGMVQIFASTTNGLYGNNTFGVTSGTSNCVEDDGAPNAQVFIESNRYAMQNDIARGSGETLNAFYAVVGCAQREQVGRVLQQNYEGIFSKDASDAQLLNSIRKTIRQNESTAQACAKLG